MTVAGSLYQALAGSAWNDLSVSATVIPLQGQLGDPDRDTDGTLLFDSGSAEQVAFVYQMPHSWKSTPVRFHCHWSKTTDAAGDVVWEMRYRKFDNGQVPPAWSEWIAATARSTTVDATQKLLVDGFPEISMSGLKLSCALSVQLRRNPAAAADNYAADARLWFADVHYQVYGLGSVMEFPT